MRSAASFRAALEVLDIAEADAAAAARTDLACRIAGLRGNVLSRMGRADEGLPTVRDALDRALRLGLQVPAAEIYQRLADSLEHSGDYRAAGRAYENAYEFCAANDLAATGQLCRACATVVMFQRGRWDRAALAVRRCSRRRRRDAARADRCLRCPRPRACDARKYDRGPVRPCSMHGLAPLPSTSSRWRSCRCGASPCSRRLVGGRTGPLESYRHILGRCRDTEERHYCLPVLQFAAAGFAAAGARADLGATTALLGEVAARTGQPEAEAAFAYALAECTGDDEDPAAAAAPLRRALTLLDGLHLPIADILVRRRLAIAIHGSDEGRAALQEALRTARRLKADTLVNWLGTDRDERPTPTRPLTDREAQVMRLVGDGMTSRAIASQLFLSVRTVEMHVRNAIAKLGCRTRAEAVRQLQRSTGPH